MIIEVPAEVKPLGGGGGGGGLNKNSPIIKMKKPKSKIAIIHYVKNVHSVS